MWLSRAGIAVVIFKLAEKAVRELHGIPTRDLPQADVRPI